MTRIGPDGTMRRRMADTAASGDVGPWEELIARALAAPPPNRPGTRGPVYHLRAGERGVLVAGHDLSGPLYELVTAVPSAGRRLEPVTSQPAGGLAAGFFQVRGGPGWCLPQEPPLGSIVESLAWMRGSGPNGRYGVSR